MIQDIAPHHLDNRYLPRAPEPQDYVLAFSGDRVLLNCRRGAPVIPTWAELSPYAQDTPLYLFTLDERAFFALWPKERHQEPPGYEAVDTEIFRNFQPSWLAFAGITGCQLARWYRNHRYCGRCGGENVHSGLERALHCPHCNLTDYAKISPAAIVAVTDRDRILLTKYAGRSYTNYALVAGYMEIGETFEDTVRREVMEEVGLSIKNIRYYKSQPWAFSDSILAGFFADLDGSPEVRVDYSELSEASWFDRSRLEPDEAPMSLTRTMIEAFRSGKYPM